VCVGKRRADRRVASNYAHAIDQIPAIVCASTRRDRLRSVRARYFNCNSPARSCARAT
jgi:hypothetical protein